jgi:hypothetical protein
MASLITTLLTEAVNITIALTVDKTELAAGVPVRVGEVGSVAGVPVFAYLSTSPALV